MTYFFRRHPHDDPAESVPARDFLDTKLSDRDYNEVLELVAESRKRAPRSVLR